MSADPCETCGHDLDCHSLAEAIECIYGMETDEAVEHADSILQRLEEESA